MGKKKTGFPDVVDNVPMDKKRYQKIFSELSKVSIMTTPALGSKSHIYNKLKTDKKLYEYLIPFEEISQYQDLELFLTKYKSIIIKQSLSNQGKNIFKVEMRNEKVYISTDTKSWSLPTQHLSTFFSNELEGKQLIVQPLIKSLTKDGNPFDIRIHTRKYLNNSWKKLLCIQE
jgi:hypothetical protein